MRPYESQGSGRVEHGDDALFKRPDMARQIPIILTRYAYIERLLVMLYATISGTPIRQEDVPEMRAMSLTAIAAATLGALDSQSNRNAVIRRSLETVYSPGLVAEYGVLSAKITNAARGRNVVAHGYWGASDHYPNELIAMGREGTMDFWNAKVYELADFEKFAKDIEDLEPPIRAFTQKVVKERYALDE